MGFPWRKLPACVSCCLLLGQAGSLPYLRTNPQYQRIAYQTQDRFVEVAGTPLSTRRACVQLEVVNKQHDFVLSRHAGVHYFEGWSSPTVKPNLDKAVTREPRDRLRPRRDYRDSSRDRCSTSKRTLANRLGPSMDPMFRTAVYERVRVGQRDPGLHRIDPR